MMPARTLRVVACAASLSACKPAPPERARAGDAGFVYEAEPLGDAGVLSMSADRTRLSIDVVAGRSGGRGDLDGFGTDARLGLVGGMAVVGNAIVFADEGNGSLRRFTPPTREVETLARLPRVQDGRPSLPAFVAYDGDSHIYVSDRARSVIFDFDLRTRALSILAGTPSERGDTDGVVSQALFDTPTGLAFDGDHALYVADVGSHAIRRIDLAQGTVSTLARGFMQVWGLCFTGHALYATDALSSAVLEVDPRTGAHALIAGSNRFGYAGSTDGPGASARFREPRGIACTQDRLYVADRGNGVVRTIDLKDHHVQTLAGRVDTFGVRDGASDGARFDDAQGILAWGEALYVGDTASLRTVSTHDGRVRTVAGTPEESGAASEGVTGEVLSRPAGVAVVASEGAAYVADCRSSSIRRVDLTTHHISVFAGDISPLVGDMLLTRFVDGPWDKARFNCAASIVYDGLGNLFVGDHYNHAVRAIHLATQRVVTVAGDPNRCGNEDGPFETATFCEPSSLAFGDGALFVADASASTIRRVDLRVDAVSTLAGKPFVRGWADGQGREARFAAPSSIVYCDGALWVADALNHVVRRVDVRSGVVDTLAGAAGHAGNVDGDFAQTRFDTPRALVCTGADELFVFDRVSVRRLSLSRRISAHVLDSGRGLRTGDVMPQLAEPVAAIGLEPGALLVVDRTENVVVRLLYPQ